jgi:hypothetical protein
MEPPAERLKRFYRIFPWVEDPFSPEGELGTRRLSASSGGCSSTSG